MLMFCPTCANILIVEEGPKCYRFACNTCPYIYNITKKISSRKYPKLKEVDDVLGGAAAWENVDHTEGGWQDYNTRCRASHQNKKLEYDLGLCTTIDLWPTLLKIFFFNFPTPACYPQGENSFHYMKRIISTYRAVQYKMSYCTALYA